MDGSQSATFTTAWWNADHRQQGINFCSGKPSPLWSAEGFGRTTQGPNQCFSGEDQYHGKHAGEGNQIWQQHMPVCKWKSDVLMAHF
jgi:hypothetical protein